MDPMVRRRDLTYSKAWAISVFKSFTIFSLTSLTCAS